MKPDFLLETQKMDQNLHIRMQGIFDGGSAWKLTNLIEREHGKNQNLYIDTDLLTQTHPIGKAILNFTLSDFVERDILHFTGDKAREIMPEGCILFLKKKASMSRDECIDVLLH